MRLEKKYIVEEIQSQVGDVPYMIVVDYTGLKVAQFNELRKRLGTAGSECRVVKNTFLTRVLKEAGLPEMETALKGQTAVVFGNQDVCGTAKLLKNFQAEFKLPTVKAGILDRAHLTSNEITALADLPSREVLLGKLLGLLQAPASQLVRLLNTPASQLAQVVKANSEKGS